MAREPRRPGARMHTLLPFIAMLLGPDGRAAERVPAADGPGRWSEAAWPGWTYRDFELASRSDACAPSVRGRRLESMEFLRSILGHGGTCSGHHVELVHRLAALYQEEGSCRFLEERQDLGRIFEQCARNPDCVPALGLLAADHRESGVWVGKATRLHAQILAHCPTYPRSDEVAFLLGVGLWDTGQPEAGAREFERLVTTWPGSPWTAEALVMLGEYHFERREFQLAITHYRRAAARFGPALPDARPPTGSWETPAHRRPGETPPPPR